jgi:hypothetical protein
MDTFSSIYSRLNERTKLIIVAVVAFWLGGLLKGGSSIGRYQACGSANWVLDTQKGTVYEIKDGKFQQMASMPW